jgi:hypothetical protein
VYADRPSKNVQFLRPFLNQRYERGRRLMLTFILFSLETTHEPVDLEKIKFGTVKHHGRTDNFSISTLFHNYFKYGDGAKFRTSPCKVLYLVQCLVLVHYLTR